MQKSEYNSLHPQTSAATVTKQRPRSTFQNGVPNTIKNLLTLNLTKQLTSAKTLSNKVNLKK